MNEYFTTGRWTVDSEHHDAFVAAWIEFATWASTKPGAGRLVLMHDIDDPGKFVSIGDWDGITAIRSWKSSDEFRERMAQVLQYVTVFEPRNLELVAAAESGATTSPLGAAAA